MYIFLNTPYGWKYKVLVACAEIHCLCQCVCMTSSCLYCDHGQSIKARRRYWQGIWSTVCFTLPLFVCVFVWVLVQASVSSHFLPAIVCMEAYARSPFLSLILSLSLISISLGWSPRLWMSYFWRFLLWKDHPPHLNAITLLYTLLWKSIFVLPDFYVFCVFDTLTCFRSSNWF